MQAPRRIPPAVCFLFLCWLTVATTGPTQLFAQDEAVKAAEFSAEQIEYFEKEVRPLLVKRCFECHGDVGDDLKGGLRLDSRAGLLKGGDTGPAIDLADSGKSLFLDAIRYGDTYQMPPKSKMPAEEIAIFEKWIGAGAPWPAEAKSESSTPKKFDLAARKASHWAWQPITSPVIPQVLDSKWPKQPIDRFILSKLEASQLQPSAEADRRILARRLYYDLIGLPPPSEKVDAFIRDASPNAVERLVDELLKSPQFGERWGRHWLDVMAYAETRGHEFDYDIPGAPIYRDYVIKAFNDDMPFNQFAMEHIAGDLIDRRDEMNASQSAIATGFWHLGEWIHSPVDIRKDETDRFDRMIDVYSKGFLGLTVSCARCHDHKFDAISQKDYHALSGFLQSMEYRQFRFESNALEQQAAQEIDAAQQALQVKLRGAVVDSIRKAVKESQPYLTAARTTETGDAVSSLEANRLAAWRKELEGAGFTSKVAPTANEAASDSRVVDAFANPNEPLLQDGFAFGLRPRLAGEVLITGGNAPEVSGVRQFSAASFNSAFAKLSIDAKLPRDFGALGATVRSGKSLRSKTFVLQKPALFYLVRGAGRAFAAVDSHRALAGPLHGGLVNAFGADEGTKWRWIRHGLKDYVGHNLHVEFTPDSESVFEVALIAEGEKPPFEIQASLQPWKQASPEEFVATALQLIEKWGAGAITHEEAQSLDAIVSRKDLFAFDNTLSDSLRTEAVALEQLQGSWRERLAAPSKTSLASWEGNAVDDDLLVRGNTRVSGGPVPRSFLTALRSETHSADQGASRLDLAKSTVAKENPLFARVAVNRVWRHLFGKGIVPTVDNFGVLGLPPSHPELLDHLAAEFIADGYSVKRLIKRIVLSSTYQQASVHRKDVDKVDPNNLLLHRMNLRRRDAEGIRDGILALSGRLDLTAPQGTSVPVHLTPYMDGRGKPGVSGPLDGDGKRSIFLAVRRNFPTPFLTVFDFPTPAAPFGARNQSNVPAQALALLNDPFVHEQAKHWANRLLAKPSSFEERIEFVYRHALSRSATKQEFEKWSAFMDKQATELGIAPVASKEDPRVWLDICHLMFNSKEFLFAE